MTLLSKSVTAMGLFVLCAVLLAGSIGVFLLYIPILPVVMVVVILVGMALAFLIGARVGGDQVLRLHFIKRRVRIKQRVRRLRLTGDAERGTT